MPAHRRREQLAVAADAVAEAVAVLIAHVQPQAEVLRRVDAEVGVEAAQVVAATLHLDRGAAAELRQFADPVDDSALATAVLAVIADAVQIEIVAGVETADAQAVETGVGAAADVGNTAQCLAQVMGAVVEHIRGLQRVDGLWNITHGRVGAGCGADVLDARVVRVGIGIDRQFRQGGRGLGESGGQQNAKPESNGRQAIRGRHDRDVSVRGYEGWENAQMVSSIIN